MATLLIRNLDGAVRDRLRVRAAQHGRSMEAEARAILAAEVAPKASTPTTGADLLAEIRAIAAKNGYWDDILPIERIARMTIQMNIAEAKAKLSELIARAEAGEDVVIARDGVPAVVLKPANDVRPAAMRPIGFLSHLGPVWAAPDAFDPMSAKEVEALTSIGPDDPLSDWKP
jgi:prevent-host-death family protein